MFQKTIRAATLSCIALLVAGYAHWLFTAPGLNIASVAASFLACLLFAGVGAGAIQRIFFEWEGASEVDVHERLGRRSLRPARFHPVRNLFLALLLARVLVYILAYVLSILTTGYEGALLNTLSLWLKGDAPHYMGLASNGYVNAGDPRFHIVFLPFYPMLVGIFNQFVNNTFVSGLFLSTVFTVFAGMLLYELALCDMDTFTARRAVKFQMLLPAAFLLNAPMSDGLFLLLTILCMLLARKKQFALACMVGAFAAFTRLQGVLLLLPLLVELVGEARRRKRAFGSMRNMIPAFFALLFVPLGVLAYLYVNWNITGDPFMFLTYQREHWSQQMSWFFNTASYQTTNFLTKFRSDIAEAFGLWLPNLATLLLAPAVMLYALYKKPAEPDDEDEDEESSEAKAAPAQSLFDPEEEESAPGAPDFRKSYRDMLGIDKIVSRPYPLRASYLVYFLAYYFVSMGATWLLSAPRYMLCCFPLSLALASSVRRRGSVAVAFTLLAVLQLLYMRAYVMGWPVY